MPLASSRWGTCPRRQGDLAGLTEQVSCRTWTDAKPLWGVLPIALKILSLGGKGTFSKGPLWVRKYPCVYGGLSLPVYLGYKQPLDWTTEKAVGHLRGGVLCLIWEVCPRMGIGTLRRPQGGEPERLVQEKKEERSKPPYYTLCPCSRKGMLPPLPPPAHGNFILGPRSSGISALGVCWGPFHKPDSHV